MNTFSLLYSLVCSYFCNKFFDTKHIWQHRRDRAGLGWKGKEGGGLRAVGRAIRRRWMTEQGFSSQ